MLTIFHNCKHSNLQRATTICYSATFHSYYNNMIGYFRSIETEEQAILPPDKVLFLHNDCVKDQDLLTSTFLYIQLKMRSIM